MTESTFKIGSIAVIGKQWVVITALNERNFWAKNYDNPAYECIYDYSMIDGIISMPV